MGNYRQHITFAGFLGVAYGAGAYVLAGVHWVYGSVAALLATLSGLLPDIDSASGVEMKGFTGILGVLAALAVWETMADTNPPPAFEYHLWGVVAAFVMVRHGLRRVMTRIAVHRGISHSLPTCAVWGALTYLYYPSGQHEFPGDHILRLTMAVAVVVGFLSHLLLDEICSVDLKGARVNRAFGTAMKFWAPSPWTTLGMYAVLSLLTWKVLQVWPDVPYRFIARRRRRSPRSRSPSPTGSFSRWRSHPPAAEPDARPDRRAAGFRRIRAADNRRGSYNRCDPVAEATRRGRYAEPLTGRSDSMRAIARSGLLVLSVLAFPVASHAQGPPAVAPGVGAAPASAPAPAQPAADPKQPLATVNGEVITRGELVDFLSRYQLPAGDPAQLYRDAIDSLINSHLVNQYLVRQRIPVTEEKVNDALNNLKRELSANGTDLATEILRSGKSEDEVRKELANRIRWVNYVNAQATDAELKKFAESHKDLFSGTQIRASHILLKLDPKASAADKEKARQKLLDLKKDIEANKITFAEAANKNSEDPANAEGAGGDIGYITLNQGIIEEFAKPAFALKKGVVSDVVETPYGLHLILITDRKEGTPLDFEQNKPLIKQVYAAELQKNLLSSERKKAKIDIKPMPADLFPAAAAAAPGAAEAEPKK